MTSASTHDSQVAIPLGTLTAGRVENLYDLMDAAYDSIESLGAQHALFLLVPQVRRGHNDVEPPLHAADSNMAQRLETLMA